jgi:hypothetical protein
MRKGEGEEASRLAQEVSTALQRVLAESPQIGQCLNRIRSEGYEVSLVLEATLGFTRTEKTVEGEARNGFDVRVERAEPAPLRMTPLDKKFLRSLKITVDHDEE